MISMAIEVAAKKNFFVEVFEELKKVNWPTREQTIRLTLVVFIISLIVGAYVGIIDVLLAKVLEIITKR
jgi:preprotein translocase subunit SecE